MTQEKRADPPLAARAGNELAKPIRKGRRDSAKLCLCLPFALPHPRHLQILYLRLHLLLLPCPLSCRGQHSLPCLLTVIPRSLPRLLVWVIPVGSQITPHMKQLQVPLLFCYFVGQGLGKGSAGHFSLGVAHLAEVAVGCEPSHPKAQPGRPSMTAHSLGWPLMPTGCGVPGVVVSGRLTSALVAGFLQGGQSKKARGQGQVSL